MKFSMLVPLVLSPLFSTAVFANGVEKIIALPADAKNVNLDRAQIEYVGVGSLPNTNGQEAYPAEATFGPSLVAYFTFETKDSSYIPQMGSDANNELSASDNTRPTARVEISISATLANAIQSGSIKAQNLIQFSVSKGSYAVPKWVNTCPFNQEGTPVEPSCYIQQGSKEISAQLLQLNVSE